MVSVTKITVVLFSLWFALQSWQLCAQEEVYSHYLDKAKKQAAKLTALYYGAEDRLVGFEHGPAGTFVVSLQNVNSLETRTLYLLSDLEHLIEGRLLSGLIRNKASAHGIKSLESLAEQNARLDKTIATFKNNITGGVNQQTAASLLDGGFVDQAQAQNTLTTADNIISSFDNDTALYDSLNELHYVQQGTGENILYVFVDHNCPACIKMHEHLENIDLPQNVSVRYIPVAIVNEDSEAKAVYTLVPSKNAARLTTMQYLMRSTPLNQLTNEIPEKEQLDKAFLKYRENTLTFFKMPMPGTPYIGMKLNGVVTLRPLADSHSFDKAISALSKVDLLTGQASVNDLAN